MNVLKAAARIILALLVAGPAFSKENNSANQQQINIEIGQSINLLVSKHALLLNFPEATGSFYRGHKFQPVWSVKSPQKQVIDAINLLNTVEQYGLSKNTYHPEVLNYTDLQSFYASFDAQKAARFELYLTDAMISLINHLHFGKMNPSYIGKKINNHYASSVLQAGIENNDIWGAIEASQPQTKEYQDLLGYMRNISVTGANRDVYRNIAVNLERLRWEKSNGSAKVIVNIPTYTLLFKTDNKEESFKIVVGRSGMPTAIANAEINQFTTTPYWSVPGRIVTSELLPAAKKNINYLKNSHYQVYDKKGNVLTHTPELIAKMAAGKIEYEVRQSLGCESEQGQMIFRFGNGQRVCLHDTPDKKIFKESDRALSDGCILVENPQRLAALLLKDDGAGQDIRNEFDQVVNKTQTRNFILRNTPDMIVRYQTCEVKNGILVTYNDIYQEDKALATALLDVANQDLRLAAK